PRDERLPPSGDCPWSARSRACRADHRFVSAPPAYRRAYVAQIALGDLRGLRARNRPRARCWNGFVAALGIRPLPRRGLRGGGRGPGARAAEGFDGRIVIVGDEPMPPYARPALSKEFLAWERQTESLHLRPDSFWAEHEIELVLGKRVLSIDRRSRVAKTDRE